MPTNHASFDFERFFLIAIRLVRSSSILQVNRLGRQGANASARLFRYIVLLILGGNCLLFLNIALAFYLSSWMEASSPAVGFLVVAGGYFVLMLLYLVFRAIPEGKVKDMVADQVLACSEHINRAYDRFLPKDSAKKTYFPPAVYTRPMALLDVRIDCDTAIVAKESKDFCRQMRYIRNNTHNVILDLAQLRIERSMPLGRYIAPALELFRRQGQSPTYIQSMVSNHPRWRRLVQLLRPALPMLSFALGIAQPVLTTFVAQKTQTWLGAVLGLKKKKKSKKWWFF